MAQLTIMQKTAITLLAILIGAVSMGGCSREEADNMGDSQNQQTASNEPTRPVQSPTGSEHSGKVEAAVQREASVEQGSKTVPVALSSAEKPIQSAKYRKATFAAGCFWGVEASFRAVEGVVATQVGYTAGQQANPTYRQVCTDTTGHAEAVQVTYDPGKVSFENLLDVFWKIHDPTTLNRQGPDVGTQYRSAILYHSPEQQALAQASIDKLEKARAFKKPIVTQIVAAPEFYEAEEYHQRYLEKQGKTSCSSTLH